MNTTIQKMIEESPPLGKLLAKYPREMQLEVLSYQSFSALQDDILLRGLSFSDYGASLNDTGAIHVIKRGGTDAAFAINNRPTFRLLVFQLETGLCL
jgi:hypothetical protein